MWRAYELPRRPHCCVCLNLLSPLLGRHRWSCVLPVWGSPVCALRVGLCGVPVSLRRISALHPGWLCNCIWIVWWGMLSDFIDVNWKYHGITVWRAFYRFLRGENVLRLLEGITIGKNLGIKYCHGHFWNMTTRKWRWWALVTHKHLYTVYLSYLEG